MTLGELRNHALYGAATVPQLPPIEVLPLQVRQLRSRNNEARLKWLRIQAMPDTLPLIYDMSEKEQDARQAWCLWVKFRSTGKV